MKKTPLSRLNIYLPDGTMRRQVKTAAAKHDLSVSEYCAQAITARLKQDKEWTPKREAQPSFLSAVSKARQFQKQTFKGRHFTVSSADLIRETRNKRGLNA